MTLPRPLAVDLDGTLLLSDMLAESFLALAATKPLAALSALAALRHGRAAFKIRIAGTVPIDFARLPWNTGFVRWVKEQQALGRRTCLASASARVYVEGAAAYLGGFDEVLASDPARNLRSATKAAALVEAYGKGGFDYAGNEAADLAVWAHGGRVVAVNVGPHLLRRVIKKWPDALVFPREQAAIGRRLAALAAPGAARALLVFGPAFVLGVATAWVLLPVIAAYLSIAATAFALRTMRLMLDRAGEVSWLAPPRGFRIVMRSMVPALVPAFILPPGFTVLLVLYGAIGLARILALRRFRTLDLPAALAQDVLVFAAGIVALG